jgi:TP53 regulating kinase and related kinases
MVILSQGAEAIIELIDGKVHKKRISKSYRHKDIDDTLRTQRTKREIKVIKKLIDLGTNVPKLYPTKDKFEIIMDFIDGKRLRDVLLENPNEKKYFNLVGEWLAKMHENGIMHGDLTTSNLMVDKNKDLFLIDFGLSFFSEKVEDMAVDIHLLKQAIESTHYKNVEEFYSVFEKSYTKNCSLSEKVFDRLKEVELRGRNKNH